MIDLFSRVHYRVTTRSGGSIELFVDAKDLGHTAGEERQAVGHATWCKLWENEKDKWGNDTGRESVTARVLRKLCDEEGVDEVKRMLIRTIQYERINNV